MKRTLALLVCALFWVSHSAFAQEEVVQARTAPAAQSVAVGADAAIVMEPVTGRVLFAQNAHARLPVASTTKILTALLTLEQPELDAVFEVDAQAIQVEGSSMGLVAGDKVTLRTLATGMLLASGNDAAGAAAVRIDGSIPAFVERMNRRVQELGLENTHFETPSGLDGPNHYSSAYDMAIITRHALQNPDFAAICAQYKMRTSYGNPPYDRWLTNHNKLLNYYEGTIGVKTGFTKKAGRCLVSAAQRNGVSLICVTLNCPNDWQVHSSLFDRYFARLQVEDLTATLPEIRLPVAGGAAPDIPAVHTEKVQVPVVPGEWEADYTLQTPPFVFAPVRKGQLLGHVAIHLDGRVVATLPLIAAADVPPLQTQEARGSLWNWLRRHFFP